MRARWWGALCVLVLAALARGPAGAQMEILDREDLDAGETEDEAARDYFLIPYAFHSDVLATSLALAAGGRGLGQDQASALVNLTGSTNGSWTLQLYGDGYRIPQLPRLFFSPRISVGDYGGIDTFGGFNEEFPDERAGSNDSDEDNFIRSEGSDLWYRLILKLLLPLGGGKETIIPRYVLEEGFLVEGSTRGETWNPLRGGRTWLELEPFYRVQDFDADEGGLDELETGGLRLSLRHENVDFLPNPSSGSIQRLTVTRDWGVQDDDASYTVVEAELVKYFDLGESERFHQRVLALDFWTAYTPTWDVDTVGGREVITHRPPNYFGAALGGVDRMRGFATARFNDKAAIYYAAELRLTPRWNLRERLASLRRFVRLDWIQVVPFVELGRVAEHWSLSELHSDMKWSAGVGIRGWVNHIVVRADFAASSEGGEVQMMVSHPFPEL